MELKEVIAVFRGEIIRLEEQLKSVDMVYREQRLKVRIEALQTAISHLETLQRVKEMGDVKRKVLNKEYREQFLKGLQSGVFPQYNPYVEDWTKEFCDGYEKGFNQALDLKNAELAGKLAGLEEIITESSLCHLCFSNVSECQKEVKDLTHTIQELFLGKKEE